MRQNLLELCSVTILFGSDPVASRLRYNVERKLQQFGIGERAMAMLTGRWRVPHHTR